MSGGWACGGRVVGSKWYVTKVSGGYVIGEWWMARVGSGWEVQEWLFVISWVIIGCLLVGDSVVG